MSVNSKMTAIADKIRSLRGISGTMGLDAMANHLGNEQTAIDSALAALAEKGVDVPSGSTSDALAGLIAAIEAGGGGVKAVTGTYTPASSAVLTVTHGLGVVPDFFAIWLNASSSRIMNSLVNAISLVGSKGIYTCTNSDTSGFNAYQYDAFKDHTNQSEPSTSGMDFVLWKANEQTINVGSNVSSGKYMAASKEYIWIAGVIG